MISQPSVCSRQGRTKLAEAGMKLVWSWKGEMEGERSTWASSSLASEHSTGISACSAALRSSSAITTCAGILRPSSTPYSALAFLTELTSSCSACISQQVYTARQPCQVLYSITPTCALTHTWGCC